MRRLIESQFNTILGNSSSKYYWFSPSLLNDSQHDIQYAIANRSVPSPGFLFATLTASNATDGLAEYERFRPHLVFMDIKMAGMDGLDALRRLRQIDAAARVVMISGHATIKTAVEATQAGAYDILEKPLDTDRVLVLLRNALEHAELAEENARLRETVESRFEIVNQWIRPDIGCRACWNES